MGQVLKAEISWNDKLHFTAKSGSGFAFSLDGDKAQGASPMEVLLAAMGGCSSIDVVMILEKMREKVTDCRCTLEGERAEDDPKVFTRIHAHYDVWGEGLKADKVRRAIELSAEKYCSASVMLGKTADITHDFTLHEVSK